MGFSSILWLLHTHRVLWSLASASEGLAWGKQPETAVSLLMEPLHYTTTLARAFDAVLAASLNSMFINK